MNAKKESSLALQSQPEKLIIDAVFEEINMQAIRKLLFLFRDSITEPNNSFFNTYKLLNRVAGWCIFVLYL